MGEKNNTKLQYSLEEDFGTLSINKSGTTEMKFTRMSWNGNPAKYDLRNWVTKNDNTTPAKGITLTKEQVIKLRDILDGLDL